MQLRESHENVFRQWPSHFRLRAKKLNVIFALKYQISGQILTNETDFFINGRIFLTFRLISTRIRNPKMLLHLLCSSESPCQGWFQHGRTKYSGMSKMNKTQKQNFSIEVFYCVL